MAVVNSPGSTPLPTSVPVAPSAGTAAPTTPQQTPPPIYQSSFTAQGTAAALGLSAPRNAGDLEALFAEISSKLGDTKGSAEDFEKAAEQAKASTDLKAAALGFRAMLSFGLAIAAAVINIVNQQSKIAQAEAELTGLKAERTDLVAQRDGLVAQRDALSQQSSDLFWESAGLLTEIGAHYTERAFNAEGTPRYIELTELIVQKEARREEIANIKPGIDSQISGLNTQIATLNGQITDLDFKIAEAELFKTNAQGSLSDSEQSLSNAVAALTSLIGSIFSFTSGLANQAKLDRSQDSFEMRDEREDLEQVLQDALQRIVDREEDLLSAGLSRDTVEQALPAGAGNADAVSGRVGSFLGVVGSILAALGQVGSNMPPSAGAQADASGRMRLNV